METEKRTGAKILAACEYMERHYTENITLSDLSRVSSLNKYIDRGVL